MSKYTRAKECGDFRKLLKKLHLDKLYIECCICGWRECKVDLCHVIPDKDGGSYCFDNIVPLCPNHHRMLDRNILGMYEMNMISKFIYDMYEILS